LVSSEDLLLLGWDDGTSWDDLGHDTTDGLNTKSKWGNINKKEILGVFRLFTSENTTLDGSAVGNGFIWVDTSVWFLSVEEVLDELLNLWDSG
jgi:hypothetical protein